MSTTRIFPASFASGPERNRPIPKVVEQTRISQKSYRLWVAVGETAFNWPRPERGTSCDTAVSGYRLAPGDRKIIITT
jgi:hypothetical protein